MAGILSALESKRRLASDGGPRTVGTRAERAILGVLALAWLLFSWPLLTGERTLLARDVFTTHLPMKYYGAQALAAGEIPAFDVTRALGQPFAGNPNALPFYPGNLLYLALPFWIAFNAHYVLHWLLAFLGMRLLARELGQGPTAATFAALTFAASGYVMTLLTFYNLLAVVAWLPLVLWGLARGGRRGLAWGGVACGLMLLAGEPVTAALATVPMLLLATERRGWRRGTIDCLVVGGVGLLVALPQIVATAHVFAFTFRGAHGLVAAQVSAHSLPLSRWLELLLPLPWGWPSNLERFGYWSKVTPITPYIYSAYCGIVALVAAIVVVRRRWRWVGLALAGLIFGGFGAHAAEPLLALTGGLFRYSQKLLLWTTLAIALLAGWGVERIFGTGSAEESSENATGDDPTARRDSRASVVGFWRWMLGAAGLCGVAAIALFLARSSVRELFSDRLGARSASVAAIQQTQWFLGALFAAVLLAVAAWAVARRRPALFLLTQLLALTQLLPLLTTARVAEFAPAAPWVAELGDRRSIVLAWSLFPYWSRSPRGRPVASESAGWADARLDLDPATGALHRLDYPVSTDLDGIHSPLTTLLDSSLAQMSWPSRLRWLRRLGADWIVRYDSDPASPSPPLPAPELSDLRLGVRSELYRLPEPAPRVRWPERWIVAGSPIEALVADRTVAAQPGDALATGIASRAVRHVPGAKVEVVEERRDHLRFAIDGGGGLAVVQRTYFPSIEARLEDGTRLATQPVDLTLLGVEVPAGRHVVEIGSSRWGETLAGVVALAVLLAALLFGARRSVATEPEIGSP